MIYLSLVQYVLHKFLTGIWVASSIRKILSFLKNLWLRFAPCVNYITKMIAIFLTNVNIKRHCGPLSDHSHTQGKRSVLRFSKNTLKHSLARQAVSAVIHKNLTLIMFFTSKETLPRGNLLKHTWNTYFKTLAEHWKFQTNLCKLLTSSPLSFLNEHKFKQYFQDTAYPLCSRNLEAESTSHSFLRCQNFTNLCKYLVK